MSRKKENFNEGYSITREEIDVSDQTIETLKKRGLIYTKTIKEHTFSLTIKGKKVKQQLLEEYNANQ